MLRSTASPYVGTFVFVLLNTLVGKIEAAFCRCDKIGPQVIEADGTWVPSSCRSYEPPCATECDNTITVGEETFYKTTKVLAGCSCDGTNSRCTKSGSPSPPIHKFIPALQLLHRHLGDLGDIWTGRILSFCLSSALHDDFRHLQYTVPHQRQYYVCAGPSSAFPSPPPPPPPPMAPLQPPPPPPPSPQCRHPRPRRRHRRRRRCRPRPRRRPRRRCPRPRRTLA